MMAQYRRIKTELPKDALLLFRLGDFYEMFFEDAVAGAPLLNVTLTKRGVIPMCGIPFHAANAYIGKILRAGRKVAICDQVEEARPGQLVKREVTQILSPGTHFDERMLQAERNNYLVAVAKNGGTFGLALVDLTTGGFKTTECEGEAALLAELDRLRPAEIVLPAEAGALHALLAPICRALQSYDDWVFAPETAQFTVREHFKVASLDGFGLKNRHAAIGAAGAVLHYLAQHLRRDLTHLTSCSFYETSDFLKLDTTTLRHLEILEPLHRDAPRNSTLYGALHKTVTPMGARCLRDWLSQPLAHVEQIVRRQEAVQSFLGSTPALEGFRAQLAEVRDLERTIGRLSLGSGNARDLLGLRSGLEQVPRIRRVLSSVAVGGEELRERGSLLREGPEAQWEHQPSSTGAFGPVFDQFRGQPAAAIAWLQKIQCGEALAVLQHPEVGEIDLVWGEARERGTGFGLAKIIRWHPEMLPDLQVRLSAMRKVRENQNTIILQTSDGEAVIRLNAFGVEKRWLLTAYERIEPASAERTIDVLNESAAQRQTPAPRSEPEERLDALLLAVNPLAGYLHEGSADGGLLSELRGALAELPHLIELLSRAIVDEPPLAVKEGGMIRDGFDAALDELHGAQRDGKDWIAKLQQDEIARTGIASLKVRFNSVFGYYIEVTRSNLDKVQIGRAHV